VTSRISSLAVLFFLAGCDPGWRIQGTVIDGAGAPIAANADKCTLAISKTGFTTRSIGSTDACYRSTHTHNLGQPCGPVEGRIALTP
jgi:hypothetical protein